MSAAKKSAEKKAAPAAANGRARRATANGRTGNGDDANRVVGYGSSRHAQPVPYWDRRRLLGEWTVEESVERIANLDPAQQRPRGLS